MALASGQNDPAQIGGGQEASGPVGGLGQGEGDVRHRVDRRVADFAVHVDLLGTIGQHFYINLGGAHRLSQGGSEFRAKLGQGEARHGEPTHVGVVHAAVFIHHDAWGGGGAAGQWERGGCRGLVQATQAHDHVELGMVPDSDQQTILGPHPVGCGLGGKQFLHGLKGHAHGGVSLDDLWADWT